MSSGASTNWKDMLKAQYKDLESLEAMDAELNANQQTITANIDKILNRKTPTYKSYAPSRRSTNPVSDITDTSNQLVDRKEIFRGHESHQTEDTEQYISSYGDEHEKESHMPPKSPDIRPRAISSPPELDLPKAPETQVRYFKAKVKSLEKQLEDSLEARKTLHSEVTDLQRQLKVEKDEAKQLKKRIALLEADSRRKRVDSAPANQPDQFEQISQEVVQLRKDLQTAERITKQLEQSEKSKDTQLKRALETITRLKSQVSELQMADQQNGAPVDRALFEATEQKVKTLEKQKSELIAAFQKQMRLIDVLKRQKAHLEAARLLAFTEDEFMKVLDWAS